MPTVDETRMKVQRILSRNMRVELTDDDRFLVRHGSTACWIAVRSYADDHTVISIASPVLFDVPVTDEVYRYVAETSNSWIFGALGLVLSEDRDMTLIDFRHSLLGDTVDEEELLWAVRAVVSTADRLDDELQPRFGGKRLEDPNS